RPCQGPPRAPRGAGPRTAQRVAPARHAVRALIPVSPDGCSAGRVGVRLAGDGQAHGRGHLPARLSSGARRRNQREHDGRARQSAGRRAVRHRRSAHPGARRVNLRAALALFVVGEARRHAAATPARRRFFQHRPAAWGLFVLSFFVTLAIAAPWVAPYGPSVTLEIVTLKNQPPSLLHPLGTDLYSRDVWSRLVYGSRVSLSIGALAMLVAVTVGAVVGAVAGYVRRWVG